jgi:uncharacterized protein (DUF433 family)
VGEFPTSVEMTSGCDVTLVARGLSILGLETGVGVARSSLCRTLTSVSQSVVRVDPEIMSGAPCFAGTRVPIQNLIDYLEGGDSIEDFLEGFPTVSREQVIAFLEEAKESVLARVV